MKKILLLFTILCTGALNGIKPEYNNCIDLEMNNLPKEVQSIVIANACAHDTLDETINTFKKISLSNKTLHEIINTKDGNLKGLETIVHMLANRFKRPPAYIANKFKTPASIHYMRLAIELIHATMRDNVEQVNQLINQGADTNYNRGSTAPLYLAAIEKNNPAIVQLLLNAGAKPTLKDSSGKTTFDHVETSLWYAHEYEGNEAINKLETIEHAFKKAIKKQCQ